MTDIVIATNNAGKLAEFRTFFKHTTLTFLPQSTFNVDDADETGTTFIENAIIKARHASKISQLPCIADDSGLVVPALNGSPGIYSARWAGPEKDYAKAINLIKTRLGNLSKNAHFTCALTVAPPSGICHTFIGHIFGQLTFPARGAKGFGYDSIFIPDGYSETFGEMDQNTKHAISHRSQAFKQLRAELL